MTRKPRKGLPHHTRTPENDPPLSAQDALRKINYVRHRIGSISKNVKNMVEAVDKRKWKQRRDKHQEAMLYAHRQIDALSLELGFDVCGLVEAQAINYWGKWRALELWERDIKSAFPMLERAVFTVESAQETNNT